MNKADRLAEEERGPMPGQRGRGKPVPFNPANPLAIRPTRTDQINRALKARGIREEIVRGNAYFYFAGGESAGWPGGSSVYVNDVSAFTIGGWIMEWHGASGKALRPNRYEDHELTETEDYFGPIRETGQHGGPYHLRYDLRPCVAGEESNHGTGGLHRERCSCGWASSWSRSRVAAMNGGKAHIRAIKKKDWEKT